MQYLSINRLDLTNFRNYSNFSLDLAGRSLILTGCNGSGKTNFLEAISLFLPGRGLRRSAYQEMIQANKQTFSLHGVFDYNLSPLNIGTEFSCTYVSRKVKIDGEFCPLDDLTNYIRLNWLIPAMDGIFSGRDSEGRQFLDRLIFSLDSSHAKRLSDYDKLLRSRNKLLENWRSNDIWLDAIELQLSEIAVAIAAARLDLVDQLNILFSECNIHSFPRAFLEVNGFVEDNLLLTNAQEVEDNFRLLLKNQRAIDAASGRTNIGIHRSKLTVSHYDKKITAKFCSTGEQKMLLIGIILCHSQLTKNLVGYCPILLLDEIVSHLDYKHRETLFAFLLSLGGQFFVTGTDKNIFSSLGNEVEFFSTDQCK
ncbi:DNA replication/repair protein RecF [Bartonella sp. DGB1]|uniref:DNA replication/repair protein RecF n=1 Tax=Bartonella sp. DGB1 TaxID=3239807 RepID=UPI003524E52D